MTPYIKSQIPGVNVLLTLKGLFTGVYDVNTDSAIDKMAERLSKRPNMIFVEIPPCATAKGVLSYVASSQARLSNLIYEIETLGGSVEACNTILAETARHARRQLLLELVSGIVYVALGVAGLALQQTLAGGACIGMAVVMLCLFAMELKMRTEELNEEFDCLREMCEDTAESLLELSMRKDLHNYVVNYATERFGEGFLDGKFDEDEYDDDEGGRR